MRIKHIFDPVERPAFPMQAGSFSPHGAPDVIEAVAAARQAITPTLASVGQVVAVLGGRSQPEGTGFLVAPDLVVSCLHVLRPYLLLRQGVWSVTTPIAIAFPDADGRAFQQSSVGALAAVNGDIAVLRLRVPVTIPSFQLAEHDMRERARVVAVGYPGKASPGNEDEAAEVFGAGGPWRLHVSPGMSWPKDSSRVVHDCSTLRGHSGCPLLSLAGAVVGIHAGMGGERNLAYSVSQIKELLKHLQA